MPTDSLLDAVIEALSPRAAEASDPRVTVGDRALLVECVHPADGSLAGVAHRPPGRAAVDPEASVTDLAAGAVTAPAGSVARAVGLATLNALSVPDVSWRVGDPMAALSPDVETIATVGLFRPAFRKFGDVSVRVVERDPASVDRDSLPEDVPTTLFSPEAAHEAFDGADVCFVTGSTLVYGGVDAYLAAAEAVETETLVVLIGATASFLPDPLFTRGVDLLAGARVDDPDRVRDRIAAGDCGTDLHDAGLTKVYCAAEATLPGLTLASPAEPTTTRTTDSEP